MVKDDVMVWEYRKGGALHESNSDLKNGLVKCTDGSIPFPPILQVAFRRIFEQDLVPLADIHCLVCHLLTKCGDGFYFDGLL